MTAYGAGRYRIERHSSDSVICHDRDLDRRVRIHWVAQASAREDVRARLAALQAVRSPYVALIYDLVEANGRVGVVEENLEPVVVTTDSNRLRCLYQLCAGLAALHANHLAHGALDESSFRVGPRERGRLCNLAFVGERLDSSGTDRAGFAARLHAMGAGLVPDPTFRDLCEALTTHHHQEPFCAQAFRNRLAALLLSNQHRALIFWQGRSMEIGARQRSARLEHPISGVATVTICYDGTRFFIDEVHGEVRVNNLVISRGADLPGSCVIVLGDSHRPWYQRYSITFDQAHPEVA